MRNVPKTNTYTGRRKNLFLWFGLFLLLFTLIGARPIGAEKGKPLSAKDVTDLLQGAVPNAEVARLVTEHGISFRLTDELERQFRAAGASDELIDALRNASKTQEAPPAPITGTLKVQSQPGEAQVYLDDEPKGQTSSSGTLRLTGIAAGTYKLRVTLTGYKTWENSITVTGGEVATAFVTLETQNLAPTVTLDADRSSIEAGQSVYLRWTSANATNVDIEPGVGKVALAGATSVSPKESTTYTLTAIGPGGINTTTTSISVAAAPPPPPAAQSVVGNLPGFPVPGASFKELKFFESANPPPPLGSRVYQAAFNHRNARYINWELNLTCPPPNSRIYVTVYENWYYPNGSVFANQTMSGYVDAGWDSPVFTSGRGWQRPGMWKRGRFRVDLFVNGNRVATGYFTIF